MELHRWQGPLENPIHLARTYGNNTADPCAEPRGSWASGISNFFYANFYSNPLFCFISLDCAWVYWEQKLWSVTETDSSGRPWLSLLLSPWESKRNSLRLMIIAYSIILKGEKYNPKNLRTWKMVFLNITLKTYRNL